MAVETVVQPPRTMMEVFTSLPEGTRVQLIENNLVMSPAPTDRHAAIAGEVGTELHFFTKKSKTGTVRFGPYVVYLDKKNAYQPDICFIANAHLDRIKENGLYGAPDLVVEVLSPATARYDRGRKKEVYERCGVTEYWIINPEDNIATGYYLIDDKYTEFFKEQDFLKSKLLDCRIEF